MLNIKCLVYYFLLLYNLYSTIFHIIVNACMLHFLRIMNTSKIYICKDYTNSDIYTSTNIEKIC